MSDRSLHDPSISPAVRRARIPISPGDPHPDTGSLVHLAGQRRLPKISYVKTNDPLKVLAKHLRPFRSSSDGQGYNFTDESLRRLISWSGYVGDTPLIVVSPTVHIRSIQDDADLVSIVYNPRYSDGYRSPNYGTIPAASHPPQTWHSLVARASSAASIPLIHHPPGQICDAGAQRQVRNETETPTYAGPPAKFKEWLTSLAYFGLFGGLVYRGYRMFQSFKKP